VGEAVAGGVVDVLLGLLDLLIVRLDDLDDA
jgi:hypothetical protein